MDYSAFYSNYLADPPRTVGRHLSADRPLIGLRARRAGSLRPGAVIAARRAAARPRPTGARRMDPPAAARPAVGPRLESVRARRQEEICGQEY